MIAADLAVDVQTARAAHHAPSHFPMRWCSRRSASPATFFGKTRLMNLCLLVVALTALVCAVATSFSLLVAMRVVAGLVAGGVFPVAMALIGDLVPVNQRQVAIGRLLAVGLTGNLLGASIAGVIGDVLGWRGVFAILGLFGLVVAIIAFFAFRGVVTPPPAALQSGRGARQLPQHLRRSTRQGVLLGRVPRGDLHPRAVSLCGAAAAAIGETRASIAGLLIAAFAMGGVFYSLSCPILVARLPERRLMIVGGALAAAGLILIALHFPWDVADRHLCRCSASASISCTAASRST